LWVETLKKIDAHLAARGKQVIMNDSPFWQKGISHPDDRENDWRLAADILSREGLARRFAVYVWHPKDVTERLAKLGFPLLRWRNRVPTAEDAQKPYDGYYLNLSDGPFDLAIATGAAQMAWSPARLSPDSAEFDAVMEAFQPVVSQLADNVALPSRRPGEKEFFTVDLSAAANEGRRDDDPSDGKGWVDLGREMDLRALRPGRRTFVGVPFDILDEDANAGKGCVIVHNPARVDRTLPMRVEVPVDRHAASLLFLHALTERPGQNYNRRAELAGFYLMVYEDGTFDKEDIKYNVNAANWDGLPTKWAYSPQGKTMKRGMLAWEGKTLAGATAALYVAEWVNPRPDKKIVRLIVSAPRLKRAASPILLAVTGVSPSGSDKPAAGRGWPVSLLASAPPQGRAIDLTGGRIVSDQAYVAPDGTTVRAEGLLNRVNVVGCDDYWTAGACVLYDNNQSARTATGAQPVVFAFPEPRRLAGVSVTPSYRQEYDTRDFQGRMHSYAIEVSPDGVSWRALPQQTQHDPEVEGPRFVSLPEDPCKAVRLKGSFAFILFHER
jgi:hypothetical protein